MSKPGAKLARRQKQSIQRRVFLVTNSLVIALITVGCLLPIWNLLALSFSNASFVASGAVSLWPKGFTTAAYQYVVKNFKFWAAASVSLRRLLLGVPINVLLSILVAYPLSKGAGIFRARKYYVAFFMVTMIFSGGLIPTFLLVNSLGLTDTIWALVLPGAVNVFNSILLLNFFRGIPGEIEESALLDGAGHFRIMLRLYIPLALPAIATITLFSMVHHWNSWFDGLIYMNYSENYPLQTYLQNLLNASSQWNLIDSSDLGLMLLRQQVNSRNLRAAQIFISIIPLLVVYPFLQKYFTTGIVLGSVKE